VSEAALEEAVSEAALEEALRVGLAAARGLPALVAAAKTKRLEAIQCLAGRRQDDASQAAAG
jgi:hypothetical protein